MGSRVRHQVLRSYSANSGTALVDSHEFRPRSARGSRDRLAASS